MDEVLRSLLPMRAGNRQARIFRRHIIAERLPGAAARSGQPGQDIYRSKRNA